MLWASSGYPGVSIKDSHSETIFSAFETPLGRSAKLEKIAEELEGMSQSATERTIELALPAGMDEKT